MKKKTSLLLVILLYFSVVFMFTTPHMSSSTSIASIEIPFNYDSLIPHDQIVILNDADFEVYNFTGSGNSTDPYLIENFFINTTGIGIEIKNTSKHFVIQNCGIISSDKCIFINSVDPGTVSILDNGLESLANAGIAIWNGCHESLIQGNIVVAKWSALDLFNCDYSRITNNHFHNSSDGIYIEESNDCLIAENTCFNNRGTGICFTFSPSVTVTDNIIVNSGYEGIATDTGDNSKIANNYCAYNEHGIYAVVTSFLYIINNTCEYNTEGLRFDGGGDSDIYVNNFYRNTKSGIYLSWCSSNTIRYNNLEENGYYGVVLNDSSESNIVHHNNFLYNIGGVSQAFDNHEQTFNYWYDININEGNFWSDIAGSFYNIDGSAGAIDPYPLNAISGTPPITTEPVEPTEPTIFSISYPYTFLIVLFVPILTAIFKRRERKN